MNKIILFTLLTTLLNASSPKVYSALGDVIYDNAEKIQNLEDIEVYNIYKDDIKKYIEEVEKTKENGFLIESAQESIGKKSYLNTLRKLSKQNDFFLRSVQNNYKESIKNEDSLLFSQLINSGLIDTQEKKEEILDYYFEHSEDINSTGVIQKYLDEDKKLKEIRNSKVAKYKTKKMLEEQKIKRIRENDMNAQKQVEQRLQEEVNKKKAQIRKNQKIELTQ